MPSRFTTLAALLGLAAPVVHAAYSVQAANYVASNFFSQFSFYTAGDPTNGFVQYVDQSTAQSNGLINTNNNQVYIGVDYKNPAPSGRQSVRIVSEQTFTHGLFILDAFHMPGGECGTWPAFWTVGPNWPNEGEIDIIEGVNSNTQNSMTLHTSDSCSISNSGMTGQVSTTNCYIYAAGQSNNAGCGVVDLSTQSYGGGFNQVGGGVYAMEWNSDAISIWFFPRNAIPGDALGSNPAPENWGTPVAKYQGSCNIDQHFADHQIVFNTDFCGDWAGNVWGSSSCSTLASSCNDWVANNPSYFSQAYWGINSLRVFSS